MKRTKIAPTLTAIVEQGEKKYGQQCNPLPRRELRALIAVARAAETLFFFAAEYEGHRCMGVSGNTDQLLREVARLDRVSGEGTR